MARNVPIDKALYARVKAAEECCDELQPGRIEQQGPVPALQALLQDREGQEARDAHGEGGERFNEADRTVVAARELLER